MSLRIDVCNFPSLPPEVDKSLLSNNGPGKEEASYLLVYYGDKLLRCESSAMEPEDVSFWRDLKWVQEALMQVYQIGEEHGYNA